MAVDGFELDKEIVRLLGLDVTLQVLIGNPIRLARSMPDKNIAFPWVRLDSLPAPPAWVAMQAAAGLDWVQTFRRQFTIFDKAITTRNVEDIIGAIFEVLEDFPSTASVTGGAVITAIPGSQMADIEGPTGAFGTLEFSFAVQDTS